MRENNFLKIALSVFVLLFLVLSISLYFVGNELAKTLALVAAAETSQKDATNKLGEKTREAQNLRDILGFTDTDAMDVINAKRDADAANFLKGQGGTTPTYRRIVETLAKQLEATNDELQKKSAAYTELEADFDNLNALRDAINKEHQKQSQTAQNTLKDERTKYADNTNKQASAYANSVAQKDDDIKKAQDEAAAAKNQKVAAEKEKNDAIGVSQGLSRELYHLKTPSFDNPDGKVISVSQESGIVTLNLGSEDGLLVRTVFTVYDPSVVGITLPRMVVDSYNDFVCSVCKRQEKLDIAKASIEVIRITGAHTADARILNDQLGDPITLGDVVYTPVWTPGQKRRFILASGMKILADDRTGDANQDVSKENFETVKRLIESNGGEVVAWTENNAGTGKVEVVNGDKIDASTTFFVWGGVSDDASEEMRKKAEANAVREISLTDLLRMMGWKDVTPVRGYGRFTDSDDHQIPASGRRGTAPSKVSDVFTPDNIPARVSNDMRPRTTAPGNVSDYYREGATVITSPGSVSDIFRPRKSPVKSE